MAFIRPLVFLHCSVEVSKSSSAVENLHEIVTGDTGGVGCVPAPGGLVPVNMDGPEQKPMGTEAFYAVDFWYLPQLYFHVPDNLE